MNLNQHASSHIESLEQENEELKRALSACRQKVAERSRLVAMCAAALGLRPHEEGGAPPRDAMRNGTDPVGDGTRHGADGADGIDGRLQANAGAADWPSTVRALKTQIAECRRIETAQALSQRMLQRLSRRTLTTLEADRKRLAKELHDSIGASLSAIKFLLEEKQARIESGQSETQWSLRPVIHHLSRLIKETKRVSACLRPSTLDDLGLKATLSWFCRRFAALEQNIRIEIRVDVAEEQIPEEYKILIYRIVQEAMTHAAEHFRPTFIRSTIEMEDEMIRVTVEADGDGREAPRPPASDGSRLCGGLQHMRERTEICGGVFKVDSRAGSGTRIRAWLPAQREAHSPDSEEN